MRVDVEDSGVGLDPQSLQRIFTPFYTTKSGGTGLGLAACRAILESHGGWLRAVPNDGPGTTVQVGLPAATKI